MNHTFAANRKPVKKDTRHDTSLKTRNLNFEELGQLLFGWFFFCALSNHIDLTCFNDQEGKKIFFFSNCFFSHSFAYSSLTVNN